MPMSKLLQPRIVYASDPAQGWIPWGFFAPLLCILFVLVPLALGTVAMQRLALIDTHGDPRSVWGLLTLLTIPFPLIGIVVLGWTLRVERRSLASIGLRGAGAAAWLRGLLIGIATIGGVVAAIGAAGGLAPEGVGRALQAPLALLQIALLLPAFALQSSVEEIVFRGWLFSVTARKRNVAAGMALTSLAFALLHFDPAAHWLVTLNLLLFSVFACCWSLKAGNIWGVMGWHSGWNWLLATGFELPVTGLDANLPALVVKMGASGPDYLTGGAQGPEGSILCTLFFLLGIAWFSVRRRRDLA